MGLDKKSVPRKKGLRKSIALPEATAVVLTACLIFVLLASQLPKFLAHDDSAYYANAIVDLTPGWMDGKPVYIWLGNLIFRAASGLAFSRSDLVLALGLYSVFFVTLSSVSVYLIYRLIFREKFAGIGAAAFVALAPVTLDISTLIAPYALALFFSTLAVVMWLRRKLLAWSLAWALAILSHASSILLIITWISSLITFRDKNLGKRVVKHLPLVFIICIASFGWVQAFYQTELQTDLVSFSLWATQEDYLPYLIQEPNAARLEALVQSVGLLLLIFSVVGACALLKLQKASSVVPFSWLAPYLFFYTVWPQAGGKFYVFCVPALSIIAMFGISSITRVINDKLPLGRSKHSGGLPPRSPRVLAGAVLILLTLMGGVSEIFDSSDRFDGSTIEYSRMGIEVNQWVDNQNASSKVLIISAWETHFIRFYSPGIQVLGWYGTMFPRSEEQIESLVLNNIDRAHANHIGVFMTRYWFYQETQRDVRIAFAASVISENFLVVETNEWLLEVLPYVNR